MPVTHKDESETNVDIEVIEKYAEIAGRMDEYFDDMEKQSWTSEIDGIKQAFEDSTNIWSALDPGMAVIQQWMEDMGGSLGKILYKARLASCLPKQAENVTSGSATCIETLLKFFLEVDF